jgi:hypothetical protein
MLALWAGQSASLARQVPAVELVETLSVTYEVVALLGTGVWPKCTAPGTPGPGRSRR